MDAAEGQQTKSQPEASFVQTEAEVDDAEERDDDDEGDDELEDMGGAFDDDADATMGMGNGYEKYISGDFEKDIAGDNSKDKHEDTQETDKEDVSEKKDEANKEKEDQEGNTETQEEQVDQKEGANTNLKAKLETVENEHKSEADILEAKLRQMDAI